MQYGKEANKIADLIRSTGGGIPELDRLRAQTQIEFWANKFLVKTENKNQINKQSFGTSGKLAQSCGCNVLPWEDCKHT